MNAAEKKTRDQLTKVRAAGATMIYLSVKSAAASVAAGLLIQNPTMQNEKGDLATKLTPFGVNYLASPEGTDITTITGDKTVPAPDAQAATDAAPVVSVLKNADGVAFARVAIELPDTRYQRKSSYPLDDLVDPVVGANGKMIYDGIFLTANDKVKEPAKAYPAIASSANKRWKDGMNGQPKRKFTSRVMDGADFNQPGVEGVGIFRVE